MLKHNNHLIIVLVVEYKKTFSQKDMHRNIFISVNNFLLVYMMNNNFYMNGSIQQTSKEILHIFLIGYVFKAKSFKKLIQLHIFYYVIFINFLTGKYMCA